MDEQNKKKETTREEKTTTEQKEIYITFLESNEAFRIKKPSDKSIDYLWDEITALLNIAKGPIKTKGDWKKVFDNWRYVTNHKARTFKASVNKTGGGTNKCKPLSDLENRALVCCGKIAIEGHPEVSSVGFEDPLIEVIELDCSELANMRDADVLVQHTTSDATPLSQSSGSRIGRLTAGDKQFHQFVEQAEQERARARTDLNGILKQISDSLKQICDFLKAMAENRS